MRATIKLTTDEIQIAIKEYVERNGWKAAGTPTITHSTDNDRGVGSTTYAASIDVQTPAQSQR